MMADNSMDSQVDYAVGQLKQGMKSKDVGNTGDLSRPAGCFTTAVSHFKAGRRNTP
ncbi:MAG: hypothetical protein ACLTGI_00705 [Hoylesella buccalis]